jgi:hypothetical protein
MGHRRTNADLGAVSTPQLYGSINGDPGTSRADAWARQGSNL